MTVGKFLMDKIREKHGKSAGIDPDATRNANYLNLVQQTITAELIRARRTHEKA